ncbi:hypothetical protein LZ318_35200 [Saccharopolyspora indica]|uniref:hypothetical protein n=1 Tax=Saccharopolyspora indica TaxID=1229659 RepID=UPI0022EAB544|nr:hypothetical protein [Saccharopolyspora indica]MDA3649834.1 hypothetical protein [Saccharopolyspora indica]
MAEVHVVSTALSELLASSGDVVRMVRGEMFFHLAQVLDLVVEAATSLGGEAEFVERLRAYSQQCREQGRAILGEVA